MKKKLIVSVLLFTTISYAIISRVFPIAAVRAEGVPDIVIGIYAEDGLAYIPNSGDGAYEGYAVEYLMHIAEKIGCKISFHIARRGMLLEDLILGKCDLILTDIPREGEYTDYAESENTLFDEFCVLYVSEDADVYYNEFSKFNGMNIGLCRNLEYGGELEKFAKENNFSYTYTYFEDNRMLFAALKSGEIDAVMTGSLVLVGDDLRNVAIFGEHDYHLIGKIDKKNIIDIFDVAVSRIKTEDNNYLNRLYSDIYWNSMGLSPGITREQHMFVVSYPTVKVGYFRDSYPLQYTDDEGNFAGIVRGFFDFYSQYTGIDFEYYEYKDSEVCRQDLEDGIIDVIATVPHYREWAAKNNLAVSDHFLKIPLYEVSLRDNDGISIGVSQYFIYERHNDSSDIKFVNYNSVKECLDGVKKGEVDLTYINEYSWISYSNKSPYSAMYAKKCDNYTVSYSAAAVADVKGTKIIELLNQSINAIPQGMSDRIVSNAISFSEDRSSIMAKFLRTYVYHIILIVVFILVIVVGIYVRKKKKKEDGLEKLAYTDTVTGIPNQAKFTMEVGRKLAYDSRYALGMIDIVNFKYINDFYGREQGDAVLRIIAERLNDFVQPDGIYARMGADRFAFMVSYLDYETLKYMVETYISELEISIEGFSDKAIVKCRCGIYLTKEKGKEKPQDIIDKIVIAEKTAKENNIPIALYDDELDRKYIKNQEMTARMKKALENEEYQVYLQPKVDIATEKPVGCEALIRWISPEKGFIPVGDFVPLFEKNGFITETDFYVLDKVCRLIRKRIDNNLPVFPININQSRLHVNNKMYLSMLQDTINKYDIPINTVVFEITESAFIEDTKDMIALINRMKLMGFQFSMDDFGSGYSSFNLLKDMPVDELKIDREFLKSTQNSDKSKYIIERIVQMAHGLDIRVVCEGVETKEQVEFLKNIDCDIIQGYYYAKPMPIDEYEKYLLKFENP